MLTIYKRKQRISDHEVMGLVWAFDDSELKLNTGLTDAKKGKSNGKKIALTFQFYMKTIQEDWRCVDRLIGGYGTKKPDQKHERNNEVTYWEKSEQGIGPDDEHAYSVFVTFSTWLRTVIASSS